MLMSMCKRRFWVGLVILGGCGVAAVGAEPPAASGLPFQVDTGASRVYIKVASTTRLGHDHGVVGQLASSTVTLGGAGDLVFDMRTFVADRPEARSYVGLTAAISQSDAQKTTATMLSKDVLSVARHPTARYTFRSATPLDGQAAGAPGRYKLDGDFTLHGVARVIPLAAVVEKTETPDVLRMRCGFVVQQTWFGMTPYTALGGLVGVGDRLQIWGELMIRPVAAATATAPSSNTAR
jgi:polyisoprenoid-binding protein YceI